MRISIGWIFLGIAPTQAQQDNQDQRSDDLTENDDESVVSTLIADVSEDMEIESPVDPVLVVEQILKGGRRGDFLWGTQGDDLIMGGSGWDDLYGAGGDDILIGGKGRDTLEGGGGDDLLIGGKGVDTAFYWGFADEFSLDLSTNTITDLLDDYGTDQLVSIEKISFIDATYKFTDAGVEKINNGFWGGWWSFGGDLDVEGQVTPEINEASSYQLTVEHDDEARQITVDL